MTIGKSSEQQLEDVDHDFYFIEDVLQSRLGDFALVQPKEIGIVLVDPIKHSSFALRAKRVLDILLATVMLLIASPILLLIACAIALDFQGEIIYRSTRVGKDGRVFPCFKFRTMQVNAHQLRKDLEHLNEREGIFFKLTNDPRVTSIGGFLRKYSLDELPQLWNVVRGEMSLVGPRPPLPEEFRLYTKAQRGRLAVTPGLTGLWQVRARRDPSFATCMKYDRHYIDNWSLALDCKILLLTIPAVLKGTGE